MKQKILEALKKRGKTQDISFLKMAHSRQHFLFFFSFWWIKFCQFWDLNRGSLVSEATALPTEPPPLPRPKTSWLGTPAPFEFVVTSSSFRHPARIPGDGLQRVQVLQGAGGADFVLAHPRGGRQGHPGPGRDDGADLEGRWDPVGLSKVQDTTFLYS